MRKKPINLIPADEKLETLKKPLVRETNKKKTATPPTAAKHGKLSTTLEDGMIVIRLPIFEKPVKSASGKSLLLGSTRGPRRVTRTVDGETQYVEFEGGYLKAIASAFVTTEVVKPQQKG